MTLLQGARVPATILLSLTLACGGGQKPAPNGPDEPPPATVGEDLVFEYPDEAMEGALFFPQALGVPGMWKIQPAKKTTLAAQRKVIAKAKASAVDLQVFAGLAWQESDKVLDKARAAQDKKDAAGAAKLEAQAKTLRTEARDALRRANEASKGQADEITLKLLAVAEITLGDPDAAAKVYGEIVQRFPGDDGAVNARTWLAHIHLMAGRTAEAAKAVDGWTVKPELDAMAAYVLAWVKYRERDYATARAAIGHAAKVWKIANRKVVVSDAVLINARAGAPFAEVDGLFAELAGADGDARFSLIVNLAKSYDSAGYWEQAIAADEALVAGKARPLQPVEEVLLRADLAYLQFRLAEPGKTADLAKESHAKLVACGDPCTKDPRTKNIVESIRAYAMTMHTLYAHSLDERYYAPASGLYQYYLAMPGAPDVEVVRGYANRLEETRKNADPKAGKHDKEEMLKQFRLKYAAVKACYESLLQGEPTLAGEVKLGVIIKADGSVEGVETTPPKGMQGLAAVGGCLDERARTWKFPGRTVAGKTSVNQKFSFKPATPK